MDTYVFIALFGGGGSIFLIRGLLLCSTHFSVILNTLRETIALKRARIFRAEEESFPFNQAKPGIHEAILLIKREKRSLIGRSEVKIERSFCALVLHRF